MQAGFLLAWLDPFLLRLHGICGPVFHCYSCPLATFACPIGVLANLQRAARDPLAGGGDAADGRGGVWQSGLRLGLPVRISPGPAWAGSQRRSSGCPAGWDGSRYAVLVGLVLVIPYFYGEAHRLFLCRALSGRGDGGVGPVQLQQSLAGDAIAWPTANKTIILAVFLRGDALYVAAVVYALLPAGGDLQPVQLRLAGVLAVRAGAVQRLRPLPRFVQVPRAVRAARGAICGASAAWSASTAGPCRWGRSFSRGKAPRQA